MIGSAVRGAIVWTPVPAIVKRIEFGPIESALIVLIPSRKEPGPASFTFVTT